VRFRNRSGRISWQSVKMFVLTANGQSAIRVANWSGKLRKGGKQTSAWTFVDKLREVLERVVGLGCGQFIGRAETLSGRVAVGEAQSFHHYSMALHRGFPDGSSGNPWLDRLDSLLDDGYLEVAIDKQYQGAARIETMAS